MQISVISLPVLVDQNSIIKTYSNTDQLSCQKYFEYLELVKNNPAIGYKKAAKLLNISTGSTRWWHEKGKKHAIPIPLKTSEKLKSFGLIAFNQNHYEAEDIFRMLGAIFGDGNIDRNLNTMSFISSNLKDIECWKNDLIRIFPFAVNKTNLIEGGEYGHSFCIRTFDRAIIRFFVSLGAPVGSKVAKSFEIPQYLFKLPSKYKVAFLDGLFSSEISVPIFKKDKRHSQTVYWKNFQFGLSKVEPLEESHRYFLKSIWKMAESVGVTFTPHIKKDTVKPTYRKDGNTSYCYRIFFQTHFHKVINFNRLFPLKYSADKKKRFENEIEKAFKYKGNNNLLISNAEPKPFNDSLQEI